MDKTEFFSLIQLEPCPLDGLVPNTQPRIIILMDEAGRSFPFRIQGETWDMLYWIWRLSDDDDSIEDVIMSFIHETRT